MSMSVREKIMTFGDVEIGIKFLYYGTVFEKCSSTAAINMQVVRRQKFKANENVVALLLGD